MKYIPYETLLQDEQWGEKANEIKKRDNYRCRMCGSGGSPENPLNVHHRYYIYDYDPWEYNSDALITLCHNCHGIIHKTISPLIYTIKKEELVPMNFTPCERCHGAGFFRQYKHVMNGVCFRCGGERYEELIGGSRVTIEKYISPEEPRFDSLDNSLSKEDLMELFNKGKAEQWKGFLCSDEETKKAYGFYKKAAIHGDAKAQNNLAMFYRDGLYVKPNLKIAKRWFVYSAMQGIPQAIMNVITLCEKNNEEYLKDEWTKIYKQNTIGVKYPDQSKSDYLEKASTLIRKGEYDKAINCLIPEAEKSSPLAQYVLGLCYDAINNKKASFKWHLKAAENGVPQSQYIVSMFYIQGTVVEVNTEEGIKWLIKSARGNCVEAKQLLINLLKDFDKK